MLDRFIDGVTRLNLWVGQLIAWLIAGMFFFLLWEGFARYVMNAPTAWTNELVQMLFGVYAILSGGYIMANHGHVNVDLLHSHLPVRWRAAVDIFTSVLFFLFTLSLLYFALQMASESISSLETTYSAWNPPIWPVKAMIPLGAFLLLLQGIAKLITDIRTVLDPHAAQRSEHA